MRRNIREPVLVVEIFPMFFWKRCIKCNQEIKKEPMYLLKIARGGFGDFYYEKQYICKKCCKDINQAEYIREKLSKFISIKDIFSTL